MDASAPGDAPLDGENVRMGQQTVNNIAAAYVSLAGIKAGPHGYRVPYGDRSIGSIIADARLCVEDPSRVFPLLALRIAVKESPNCRRLTFGKVFLGS